MSDGKPLTVTVARVEREDRWFCRVVLRRRTRRRILFAGYCASFDFAIDPTGIATSTVVVRDPAEALTQVLLG